MTNVTDMNNKYLQDSGFSAIPGVSAANRTPEARQREADGWTAYENIKNDLSGAERLSVWWNTATGGSDARRMASDPVAESWPSFGEKIKKWRADGHSDEEIMQYLGGAEQELTAFYGRESAGQYFGRTAESAANAAASAELRQMDVLQKLSGKSREEVEDALTVSKRHGVSVTTLLNDDELMRDLSKDMKLRQESEKVNILGWDVPVTWLKIIGDGVNRHWLSTKLNLQYGVPYMMGLKKPSEADYKAIESINRELALYAPAERETWYETGLGQLGEQGTLMGLGMLTRGLASAGAGLLGAGTAGAAAAGETAGFMHMFAAEGGGAMMELMQMRDRDGNPLDFDVARGAAIMTGIFNGVIENMDISRQTKLWQGSWKMAQGGAKEFVKAPTLRRVLANAGKNWAEAFIREPSQEALQEAVTIGFAELAKGLDRTTRWDAMDWGEARDRIAETMGTTLKGQVFLGGFGAAGSSIVQYADQVKPLENRAAVMSRALRRDVSPDRLWAFDYTQSVMGNAPRTHDGFLTAEQAEKAAGADAETVAQQADVNRRRADFIKDNESQAGAEKAARLADNPVIKGIDAALEALPEGDSAQRQMLMLDRRIVGELAEFEYEAQSGNETTAQEANKRAESASDAKEDKVPAEGAETGRTGRSGGASAELKANAEAADSEANSEAGNEPRFVPFEAVERYNQENPGELAELGIAAIDEALSAGGEGELRLTREELGVIRERAPKLYDALSPDIRIGAKGRTLRETAADFDRAAERDAIYRQPEIKAMFRKLKAEAKAAMINAGQTADAAEALAGAAARLAVSNAVAMNRRYGLPYEDAVRISFEGMKGSRGTTAEAYAAMDKGPFEAVFRQNMPSLIDTFGIERITSFEPFDFEIIHALKHHILHARHSDNGNIVIDVDGVGYAEFDIREGKFSFSDTKKNNFNQKIKSKFTEALYEQLSRTSYETNADGTYILTFDESDRYSLESGEPITHASSDDYVLRDGKKSWGRVKDELVDESRGIYAGEIYVPVGKPNAEYGIRNGNGIVHVRADHALEIDRYNGMSPEDFISYTLENMDRAEPSDHGKAIFIYTSKDKSASPAAIAAWKGTHYELVTAYIKDTQALPNLGREKTRTATRTPTSLSLTTERQRSENDGFMVRARDLRNDNIQQNGGAVNGGQESYEQRVYHGTRHLIEALKMSLDKVGIGEGHQAYGWGLYFAGARGTSEYYRSAGDHRDPNDGIKKRYYIITADGGKFFIDLYDDKILDYETLENVLADKDVGAWGHETIFRIMRELWNRYEYKKTDEKVVDIVKRIIDDQRDSRRQEIELYNEKIKEYKKYIKDIEENTAYDNNMKISLKEYYQSAIDNIQAKLSSLTIGPDFDEMIERLMPVRYAVESAFVKNEGKIGNLYQFDIPDDNELLNWDDRLVCSSQYIQDKVKELFSDLGLDRQDPIDRYKGIEIYQKLVIYAEDYYEFTRSEAAKWTSLKLLEYGIPGLMYWDQRSRFSKEGTHNYVIWDADRIQNGELIDAETFREIRTNPTFEVYEQLVEKARAMERGAVRGTTSFGGSGAERQSLISFFANMNASTPFHELAHHMFDVMHSMLGAEGVDAQLAADFGTVLEHAGVSREQYEADAAVFDEFTGAVTGAKKKAHEYFARSFEAYLREGVAPSSRLKEAFRRIKAWLVEIYRSVVQELGIELDGEMREVFDRLLASPDEIADSQRIADAAAQDALARAEIDRYESMMREREEQEAAEGSDEEYGIVAELSPDAEKAVDGYFGMWEEYDAERTQAEENGRVFKAIRDNGGIRFKDAVFLLGPELARDLRGKFGGLFRNTTERERLPLDILAQEVGFERPDELLDWLDSVDREKPVKPAPLVDIGTETLNALMDRAGAEGALEYMKERRKYLKRLLKEERRELEVRGALKDIEREVADIEYSIERVNELVASKSEEKAQGRQGARLSEAAQQIADYISGELGGVGNFTEVYGGQSWEELAAMFEDRIGAVVSPEELEELVLSPDGAGAGQVEERERKKQAQTLTLYEAMKKGWQLAEQASIVGYRAGMKQGRAEEREAGNERLQVAKWRTLEEREIGRERLRAERERGREKMAAARERFGEERERGRERLQVAKWRLSEEREIGREKLRAERDKWRAKIAALRDGIRQRLRVRQETAKLLRSINKMADASNVIWSAQQEIKGLLSGYDLHKRSEATLARRAEVEAWAREGHVMSAEDMKYIGTETLGDMSLDDLRELESKVAELYGQGRREFLDWQAARQQRADEAHGAMRAALERTKAGEQAKIIRGRADLGKQYGGMFGGLARARDWMYSMTLDPYRFFDWLDKGRGKMKGAFVEYFGDKVNEAVDETMRNVMRRREAMGEALRELGFRMTDFTKRAGEYEGVEFSYDEIMEIYAGMKNEKKAAAILSGNFGKLGGMDDIRAAVEYLVGLLSDEHKAAADLVIADHEREFDRINDALIRAFNKGMDREQDYTSIHRIGRMTRDGVIDADTAAELEGRGQSRGEVMGRLERGFMIERVDISDENQTPVKLGLFDNWSGDIYRHEHAAAMGELAHTLASAMLQRDTDGASLGRMVRERFGDNAWRSLVSFFNDSVVVGRRAERSMLDDIAGRLARNMSLAYLSANMSVPLKQFTAIARGIVSAGPGTLMKHIGRFIFENTDYLNWVYEMAPQVGARNGDMLTRMVREEGGAGTMRRIAAAGMATFAYSDRWVAAIVWGATYEANMKRGVGHDAAKREADRAVNLTQQASQSKDASRLWRTSSWARLGMIFTSDAAKTFNMTQYDLAQSIIAAVEGGSEDRGGAVMRGLRVAAALGMTAFLMKLLTSGGPDGDEPEELLGWAEEALAEQSINSLPLIGKEAMLMYEAMTGKYRGTQYSSLMGPFERLARGVRDWRKDNTERAVLNVLEALALGGAPIPVTMLRRGVQAYHLTEDEEYAAAVGRIFGLRL